MADFTKLTQNLAHVSALPDRPSIAEGYTPEQLKNKFDQSGLDIQTYLNMVLIPQLQSTIPGESASEKIGSRSIAGVTGNTLYAQMSHIAHMIGDAVAGTIPDSTITLQKLSPTLKARFEQMSLNTMVYTTPGNHSFLVPRTGYYHVTLCGGGAAGSMYALDQDVFSTTHYGYGGASGAYLEFSLFLEEGDSVSLTVGAGGAVKLPSEINATFSGSVIVSYSAPGGNTIFGSLIAMGGCNYAPERPEAEVQGEKYLFCRNGKSQPGTGSVHDGLDSMLGNGSRRIAGTQSGILTYSAGIGAGGCGFVYTDDTSNKASVPLENRMYYLNRGCTAGGSGMVKIQYMNVIE